MPRETNCTKKGSVKAQVAMPCKEREIGREGERERERERERDREREKERERERQRDRERERERAESWEAVAKR